jgi:acetylornithine deacetylase/succinyl-diaminopimelate desuccinylase-like protein
MQQLGAGVRLLQAGDGPPVVFGELGQGARSLLSYTHYDVQPPDPLDEWVTPPFEPTLRDGKLYARGTCDDKGDTVARLQAVEVYRAVYGDLPLRLKYFVEGEEETGSPHLESLAAEHRQLLRADGAVWEGGGFDESERYTLHCGVKGIQYLELNVRGAAYDLHSSLAPMVVNPAWRLAEALNTLRNQRDEITIDGFMEHVRPPTEAELDEIRRIPFPGDQMKATWGIETFINDMTDDQALVRYLTQPTCTICGLRSGFIDQGSKTVLPSTAMAKLDLRLVPDLTPELAANLLREHLDRRGYTDIEIRQLGAMVGMRSDVRAPVVRAATQAACAVYGAAPVVYPSIGGSGPMYALIGTTGTPGVVTAGLTYPGMRMHAPNENIRQDDYFRHLEFLVELMRHFAAA